MNEEGHGAPRDLWVPVLVGLVGALVTLGGWGLLVADRRELLLESTRETAAEVAEAVELGLAQQLAGLRGLGDLWTDFGPGSLDEWRAEADPWVDRTEGLESVAWVDFESSRVRIATGQSGSAVAPRVDVEETRPHAARPHLEGPERDASGSASYRIFLPIRAQRQAGVLVGRFRAEPFLEHVLQARARGYALSISWDGERIFSRGSPSDDPLQDWWRVEQEVELPLGGRWRIVHRPTSAYAAARLTPLPHYLLAAGLVLSALLAVAAHQMRVILRQSNFLAASNRALEQRGVELESVVARRTEALQEAVVELESFNYSVSHDLRSPLGAILNFTAILGEDYRERPLDAEGIAILARIRRSALRATALLEDLLRLSRAGRGALSVEWVEMTDLAKEVFAQVRVVEDDVDVEFHVDSLPATHGDRSLLGDVFANLLGNALKYSRGCEKRRIEVSGRIEGNECVYEVADTGHGFDMRFVDKVFGLFERLHSAEDVEGTGVGLAMVARIVKRHGGRVWAEAQPGEGARFSFALPAGGASR